MSYFYVKSGGTATGNGGRYASQQTGTFAALGASGYYDSLEDVKNATNPPVNGDFVLISDLHSKTYATATVLGISNITDGNVQYICVSDAAIDQVSSGASETVTTGDFDISTMSVRKGNAYLEGLSFTASAGNVDLNIYEATLEFVNCNIDASGDFAGGRGSRVYFIGGQIDCDEIYDSYHSRFRFDGTTINARVAVSASYGKRDFYNCDLSGSTLGVDLLNMSGAANGAYAEFHNCKMPATYDEYIKGTYSHANYMEATSIGEYYHLHHESDLGLIETDTATYLNATYDGTNGFSLTLESTSECHKHMRMRYPVAVLPAQDLTTDKTYTVEFTCNNALTDHDFWIEIERPDGTDRELGVIQSSRNSDILAVGTTHTTSSETWTGGLTNKYKDSLTVTGMAGIDNATVTIYACLAKANEDVNVDPAVTIT